jgi:LPXTG-motif cell wall-anchored protein
VNKMVESTRKWACVSLLAAAAVLSVGASAATAAPGDPTAEECAIIAADAAKNGTTIAAELAKVGGGTCPDVLGVTIAPAKTPISVAVLPAAVAASGTLPKSGNDVSGTLAIAGIACLVGGALVMVNRKRSAPPTSD